MPGNGIWPELKATKIFGREFFVEAFRVQPRERFAIAGDAQRKMNVLWVVWAAGALQRAHPDDDVKMLLSIAETVPDAREIERGALDFLEFEHIGIKVARAFEVVNADENVVEIRFDHVEIGPHRIRPTMDDDALWRDAKDDRASGAGWK